MVNRLTDRLPMISHFRSGFNALAISFLQLMVEAQAQLKIQREASSLNEHNHWGVLR